MTTKESIRDYLKKAHTGRNKAVHSYVIEGLLNIDGRTVRKHISKLRQQGVPICSCRDGYYYAEKQNEINETVAWLNEHVTKVSNARTGLLYSNLMKESGKEIEIVIKVDIK